MAAVEREHGRDSPQLAELWRQQSASDARNIKRLEAIIAELGWPKRSVVGARAASAAFLILQHADISAQKKYLPLARAAAAENEMQPSSLALLEDRILLREGKKQIYGSQVQRNEAGEWDTLPLEDPANVDQRRASVGLPPLADYLAGFAQRSGGKVADRAAGASLSSKSTATAFAEEHFAYERAYQQSLARQRAEKAKQRAALAIEVASLAPPARFHRLMAAARDHFNHAEFQPAIRVYNEAMAVKPTDVPVSDELHQLQSDLKAQNSPVELQLQSDGRTFVVISNHRLLRTFQETRIPIPPGDYEIVGRRHGFAEVIIPLRVRNGTALPPLTVICRVLDGAGNTKQ
jgi:hypothetical protein